MIAFVRSMILLFLVSFCTQLLANTPNAWLKTSDILTVCSYSEFKPISYGHGEGYEADMLRAIAKLWGVKIRFYPENIYEGIWRLPSRAYTLCDISIGGISPTKFRQKQDAVFSIPTTHFKQSLLVRAQGYNNGSILIYNDFKHNHRKIGVVPSTTGEEFAYRRAKDAGLDPSTIVQYPNETQLLTALKQNKIDAIARGEIGNEYQASIDPDVVVTAKRDFGEAFSFVVNPSKPEFLHAINSAIATVTNCGKIGFPSWLKDHNVFIQKSNTAVC